MDARFLRDLAALVQPDHRIGVAVSGGADSVTLLDLLHRHHKHLVVLHVDHQLRGAESDADCTFVAQLARDRNLPFESRLLPPAEGENVEQSARDLRYAFFREMRVAHNLDHIALGHTRSDQAETVLFRFLRGAGTAGLAAMRAKGHDGIIRPLLDFSREEVRAYAVSRNLAWREDTSNANLDFARNQIRAHLLPQLARDWNPAIEATLAQLAQWAQAEEDYWDTEIDGFFTTLATPAYAGHILNCSRLNELPLAAARRLIRRLIETTRGDLRGIGFDHTEQIRTLAASSIGSGRVQIPGVDIMRSFDQIRFAPLGTYSGDRFFGQPITIPEEIHIPGAPFVLSFQLRKFDYRYNDEIDILDESLIRAPLHLRTWQPGDHYASGGRPSGTKMKTLFQEARIPLWERRTWPVLTMEGEIVWSRSFGPAARFAVTAETRSVLRIRERKIHVGQNEESKAPSPTSRESRAAFVAAPQAEIE